MPFKPILSDQPRVLILGSMPSKKSLDKEQYYGNPLNSFWWIMSKLVGFSLSFDYSDRVEQLKKVGVCVWDVLNDCERKGSLDQNIVRDTELPNDIVGFLDDNKSISLVAFNGGAAKAIFHRHNRPLRETIEVCQLPSSSPAFASMNKEKKFEIWQDVVLPHLHI